MATGNTPTTLEAVAVVGLCLFIYDECLINHKNVRKIRPVEREERAMMDDDVSQLHGRLSHSSRRRRLFLLDVRLCVWI